MAKRISGYMAKIQVFLEVDPKDPADTIAKAGAVQKAQNRDISEIIKGRVVGFDYRYVSTDPSRFPTQASLALEPGDADPGTIELGEDVEIDERTQAERAADAGQEHLADAAAGDGAPIVRTRRRTVSGD